MGVELLDLGAEGRGLRWEGDGRVYKFRNRAEAEAAYLSAVKVGLARGETADMSAVERAAAREVSERVGVRKAVYSDLIVAYWLPPDLAARVALTSAGAVAPEDMHLTLLYLGDPADYDLDLVAALVKVHSTRCGPVEAQFGGRGRFVVSEDEDAEVLLVDSPDLSELRQRLCDALCYGGAIPHDSPLRDPEHGYIPHVTVGYVTRSQAGPSPLAAPVPFELDNLTVAAGPVRVSFPLEERREAYAEDATVPYTMSADSDEDLSYLVTKAADERRYTMGVLYAPNRKDAHGEFVDPETLQEALWEYVKQSADEGRQLNLQHGELGDVTVGEWVEVMAWPYEHEIEVTVPGEATRKLRMPAGTTYMGVIWSEEAWPLVKRRQLTGYSMGGKAVRVATGEDLERMGDKNAAQYSAEQRRAMAQSGEAMPDGSYPIRTRADLRNAVQAYGRAGNKAAVKRHIIKRARALGAVSDLPESWNVSKSNLVPGHPAGRLPTPTSSLTVPETEVRELEDALRRVAIEVKPQGGYGDTFFDWETRTVWWNPADWTSAAEEATARRLLAAVPGVEQVIIADAESAPPDGPNWTEVLRGRRPRGIDVEVLTRAAEAASEQVRAARAEAREERGLLLRAFESMRDAVVKRQEPAPGAQQHFHLPGTELTVHTPDVKVDAPVTVEAARAPDVSVTTPPVDVHVHLEDEAEVREDS